MRLPCIDRALRVRLLPIMQLAGTLCILAWIPTNAGKTAAFLLWWLITFRGLRRSELVLYALACAFFTVMNVLSLRQGIFSFTDPDLLGMPSYEFFLWGFYLLHMLRMLGGPAPPASRFAWILALMVAAAFSSISDPFLLTGITGVLLGIGLMRFHEAYDIAYAGYAIVLGAAVEYTGVHQGQWVYPGDVPGGVPFWFITLWGSVGLLLRRLVLPLLPPQAQGRGQSCPVAETGAIGPESKSR